MSDPSFQDILNTPADQIKPPVALPPGTYICVVDGQPEYTQKGQNNTNCIVFPLKPVGTENDVNQETLLEALDGAALADKKLFHTVWMTNGSKYRALQFLHDHLGIPKQGRLLGEMVPEAMGKSVLAKVDHYIKKDGSIGYQVASTGKVKAP